MWAPEEGLSKQPLISNNSYGSPLENDPNWRGVNPNRKCRDVVFAIIFILAFIAQIAVGSVGYSQGDPSTLVPSSNDVEAEIENTFQNAVAILKQDKYIILGGMLASVVLAAIWVQLMKMFTKVFIYIMLIGGIAGITGLGAYLIIISQQESDTTLQWIGIVCCIVAFFLLVATFFLRKKIALTAALFKEACRGVQHNPALFIVALVIITLILSYVAFWLSSFVYLYSIPSTDKDGNETTAFNTSIRNLMWYQVFGAFWTLFTLSAVFQHSIAGGISSYYFTRTSHNYKESGSPSFRALFWGFTTSFGSLALGSLVVAILAFLNFMLEKTKQGNKNNKVVKVIISCIQCCLASVQKLVEWINKFCFIYIAMHGDGFCTSCKGVFNLIGRNFFSAVIVDLVGDFVLFVGKLLGTAIVTIGCVALLDSEVGNSLGDVSPLSVAVIALGTFLVFNLFANIVNTSVDTILICYLEDIERNKDGDYHASTEMHNLLQSRISNARAQK